MYYLRYDPDPDSTTTNTFHVVGNTIHYKFKPCFEVEAISYGAFPFVRAGRDVSTPKGTANLARVDSSTYRAFGTGLPGPVYLQQVPDGLLGL